MNHRNKRILERATAVEGGNTSNLDKALVLYSDHLLDRSSGVCRMNLTAMSHRTAVKAFMSALTAVAVRGLTTIGVKGGTIDVLLQTGKLKATSVKTYLHALAGFLGFVAGEARLLRQLRLQSNEVDTIRQKVLTIARTLRYDIYRQAMEKVGQTPHGALKLKPWMAGKYLEGGERAIARELITREAVYQNKLTPREWCKARNSLILQLLLSNFKRPGDLAHLERRAVLAAQLDPAGPTKDGMELYIIQHKEAMYGKRCPLFIDTEMFDDLQLFARHLAKTETSKGYLFTTKEGKMISPTTMSKIIESTWAAFGKRIGYGLPKLTGVEGRKLAVTVHREAGADREEQTALACHMSHNVETADKYYNKAQTKASRSKALRRVKSEYKKALKAHEKEKRKLGF